MSAPCTPLTPALIGLMDQMPFSVLLTDSEGVILYVNPAFESASGYSREEALGKTPSILKSGRTDPDLYNTLWTSLQAGQIWRGEFENRRKDGALVWERVVIVPMLDEATDTTFFLSLREDITETKVTQQETWHKANHDTLTGLANRVLFQDRLASAIAQAKRQSGRLAVMFVDLDHFKNVNDTLGHAAGDCLLKQVSERLLACLRDTDTLARLGGDEFTILLVNTNGTGPGATSRDHAVVAQRILDSLRRPFTLDGGREVLIGGSVGITLFPEDSTDADTLIRNADSAMYRAKTAGRNTFCFFTQELNREIQDQISLENDLRRAVRNMDLTLVYQPMVDSETLQVLATEALLRWPRGEAGFVPPSRFIPIAEDLGLIEEIGSWVLETACAQAMDWRARTGASLQIAVNTSWRQLRNTTLPQRIGDILTKLDMPAHLLELEISEAALARDPDRIGITLEGLRELGVTLAIDNFGSGHSSIKTLRQFPFGIMKLDRKCVADMLTSHEDAVLVETATIMARRLGLRVVAEGVETDAQLTFLRQHYCDLIQGFLFGQPLPAEELVVMLSQK